MKRTHIIIIIVVVILILIGIYLYNNNRTSLNEKQVYEELVESKPSIDSTKFATWYATLTDKQKEIVSLLSSDYTTLKVIKDNPTTNDVLMSQYNTFKTRLLGKGYTDSDISMVINNIQGY